MSYATPPQTLRGGNGFRTELSRAGERIAVGSDGEATRADQGTQPDLMTEALRRWVSEGGALSGAD